MSLTVTVTLSSDLSQSLRENALQNEKTLDELVNEAVKYYLLDQQRQKIDQEIVAYQRMHPELWRSIPGQWVAVHHGNVVDQDEDRVALYQRVRAEHGRTPVLIRQVTPQVTEEIWMRTPSTGKVQK